MTNTNVSVVRTDRGRGESITYVIAQGSIPDRDKIPWETEECDVFVVTLDGKLLPNNLADEIAIEIVSLPVDWVETFGPRCEYLHDRIDAASVLIGRQEKVGDGSPMTAWHNHLSDIEEIVSYLRTGGQGSAGIKIVLVIGAERSADEIREKLIQLRN